MKQTLAYFAALAALLSMAAMSACIFDTRDAEPPGEEGQPSVVLDAPQQVFVAIESSFEKDNSVDYERALSATFIFSPTPEDSLDQTLINTGAYANWTKQVELDVLQLLLSESNLEVTFETKTLINKNTFVRFEAFYILGVITAGSPPDTTVYSGTSWIDVKNEGGNWRITYWKDISAELGFRTWGYLRGISRLRLGP